MTDPYTMSLLIVPCSAWVPKKTDNEKKKHSKDKIKKLKF